MLWLAYILLALAVAYALHQRARRKAAEWDRDDARAEADRLERALFGCRTYSAEIISERDQNAIDLAACRRELETARQDHEMKARSHGNAVVCAAERERLVEGYARDILTALGREAS
jgi:hypothetical protein